MKELPDFHGSDIEKVARYFHLNEADIINFSGNVNPLGLSETLADKLKANIDLVTNYPDPDYVRLKESIASYVQCDTEHILLGNGTTELIAHYMDYVNPKNALIIGPTYSEYEKKMTTIGTNITYLPLEKEKEFQLEPDSLLTQLTDETDLLVLCNPNNPTATLMASHHLIPIFDHCKAHNIHILIDETYMDFVEDADQISAINLVPCYSNCIVLRGFSKFFSAPGLRLGYGITSDFMCHEMIALKRHHWSINSLAAFAGSELMTDQDFIRNSKSFITKERERVQAELLTFKEIHVYPTACNFFLIECTNPKHSAKELFAYMIQHHLMIRDASSFPFLHGEFFRFCLLTPEHNDQLLACLKAYLA